MGKFLSRRLVVTFRIGGKLTFLDLHFVAEKRFTRIRLEMAIGFDKLQHEVVEQSKKIVEDQGLAATMGS